MLINIILSRETSSYSVHKIWLKYWTTLEVTLILCCIIQIMDILLIRISEVQNNNYGFQTLIYICMYLYNISVLILKNMKVRYKNICICYSNTTILIVQLVVEKFHSLHTSIYMFLNFV